MRLEDVQRIIARRLKPLETLVQLVTGLNVNDRGAGGRAQGLADNEIGPELVRHYGFYSRPPEDADGVVLRWGGLSLAISYRKAADEPALEKGEVQVKASSGASTKFDKDGNVSSTPAASGKVKLAGDAHPLPLWDTFESDLFDALTIINTAGVAPSGGGTVTYTDPLGKISKLLAGLSGVPTKTYESEKAANG